MDLEVSTWTRRERLERIASAERDRRVGRGELALATLGEGNEWPARVVLALIRLPEGEGTEARAILEGALDAWAADSGLEGLDAAEVSEEATHATSDEANAAPADEVVGGGEAQPTAETLETPIAIDELERAFAEAEAQTDEMLDVNTVAARVLMEEPMGLMEIDDAGPAEPMLGEPIETDAAWAIPSTALSSGNGGPPPDYDVAIDELVATDASESDYTCDYASDPTPDPTSEPETVVEGRAEGAVEGAIMDAAIVDGGTGARPRKQVVETLERWLSNLERGRSLRNAQQNRGA